MFNFDEMLEHSVFFGTSAKKKLALSVELFCP
jgi:hypothetical protein